MKARDIIKQRNWVAKAAQQEVSGAGRHEAKRGKRVKRARAKHQFRKELAQLRNG